MINRAFFHTHKRAFWLLLGLVALNVLAWVWAFALFSQHAGLIAAALLAYGYGLRHAVDADHIAAIDNVTRKLMQQGQRPVAVGAYFSLGHSSIVVLACAAIAATSLLFGEKIGWLHDYGSTIGTLVSALFLFIMAAVNAAILRDVWRRFGQVKRGESFIETENTHHLQGGVMTKVFRFAFGLVNRSWQMYLVGFLFGLGFDTATEIGLLGISAAGASSGMSVWSIMVFAALFTAAMTLIDTTDGVLMLGAYGWAFTKPIRKLYYNLTITFVSVLVAVLIGGIEALGLLADQFGLEGGFWDGIGALN